MRSDAPALWPLLRSRPLSELLTVFLLHPDVDYTLSELAATLGLPLTTVQREVTRLSTAQLVTDRRVGPGPLGCAALSSRYARPLTELVTLAFGPHFVIAEEFGSLDAIAVAIYGSWAARYEGVEGHPPHDVDGLVIGEVPRRDIYEAAERAEQRLGLPVNPVLCPVARWLAAADPLIQQIRTAPLVWVVAEE